ncbi:MAG: hypothetical protein MUE53_08980 [Chitinophagales bacterium]|jgi:hypothetical protein|nr:hypothetical protein [Chitinophagales bacterium]
MYYLAFFIDYQPFFAKKLKSWLSNRKNYTSVLIDETTNHNSVPIAYFLKCIAENRHYYREEPWYSRYAWNWYIHGKCNRDVNLSEFPALQNTILFKSLETLNNTLTWMADTYEWTILPWSNLIRFRSFVFIAKDKYLRDKFIQCSSNNYTISFLSNNQLDLFIKSYDVSNQFSQTTKGIVFQENINTLSKIWNACDCDRVNPLLLTNVDFKKYFLSDRQQALLKSYDTSDSYSKKWSIYNIKDKEYFELISREIIGDKSNKTAFWIPQTADISKLIKLLTNTESIDTSYSDLIYFKDFLNISEWIYGFSRDFDAPDANNCSLLISQNSNILAAIDLFRTEKNSDFYLSMPNQYYNLLTAF